MEKSQEHTRRKFLRQLFSSSVLMVCGSISVLSCQNKGKQKKEDALSDRGGNCGDYSKLSQGDLDARKKLGYVSASPVEDQQCHLCNLYLPPKQGQSCGGCTLFKGPIDAGGTCTYWSPKQG